LLGAMSLWFLWLRERVRGTYGPKVAPATMTAPAAAGPKPSAASPAAAPPVPVSSGASPSETAAAGDAPTQPPGPPPGTAATPGTTPSPAVQRWLTNRRRVKATSAHPPDNGTSNDVNVPTVY